MKNTKWLICLLISFLILFGGITNAQEYSITWHTGAVGGLYMEPAVIWAEQLQKALPNLTISVILGSIIGNPIEVSEADPNTAIGIDHNLGLRQVISGEGQYKDKELTNLRALWRFNVPSYTHILARPGVIPEGIKTFGEFIKTKPAFRLAVKVRGSGGEDFTRRLLEYYGVTYDDIAKWGGSVSFNNPNDIAALMIDGHADISTEHCRVPAAAILDMDASIKGLTWVPIEEDALNYLVEKYGYGYGIHPTEYYTSMKGLEEPYISGLQDHIVFMREESDEELVYNIVKTIMLEPEMIKNAIPAFESFDPSVAGKETTIPLHEGAKRAYKELGLIE